MLFPYVYVPHQMEKMQTFIDFIFFEVWCKAPIGLAFHVNLFDLEPDLKEVMSEFGFSPKAPERGKTFYKEVKSIYESFAMLSAAQVDQLRQWYGANNEIQKICANDPATSPARYADVTAIAPNLAAQLGAFFKGLYSRDLLGLAALRAKIGDIDDHYNQAFLSANRSDKCPFCGIGDIKGPHHTKREAYDHYLPKALYPFNSINFRNLAPACHECNSTYKQAKDPAHNAAARRKAFYPYGTENQAIEITIDLGSADIDKLTPADIQIAFGPPDVHEEIATWIDVYGIDERYKAKCCSGDAKDWLEQIRILRDAHGIAPDASLANVQQQAEKAPVANSNFLKRAFLEGCQRAGLFGLIAEQGGAP